VANWAVSTGSKTLKPIIGDIILVGKYLIKTTNVLQKKYHFPIYDNSGFL